jgi:hypothetical protein
MRRSLQWYPLRVLLVAVLPWIVCWAVLMGAVGMDPGSAWLALGLVVVPTTVVALSSTVAAAADWALGRGARFAEPWNRLLWRHLTRTRVARTLGVTVGFAVPMVLNGVHNASGGELVPWWPDRNGDLTGYWMPALGYVVGSVWAEVRKPRPSTSTGAGAALLTPRRLGDYLDPNVSWVLGVFSLVCVFVVTVWAFAPLPLSGNPVDARWVRVAAPAAVAAAALLSAAVLARRVERAADDAALAYEELTRTATVNALAGASIAMLGELAVAVASMPHDGRQISGWILLPIGLLSLLGLGIWIGCGTKLVFRSRRIDALRAAA